MALVWSSMALVYVFVVIISWCPFKVVYSIWWKMMIEKQLEKQGFHGPPYKLLYGNIKDMKFFNENNDQPRAMKTSHDISPLLDPFLHNTVANYGDKFVTWFGTTPRVTITDPKLIREIMSNKSGDFLKPRNSFIDLLVTGVASYHGEKWAKHRKIINPAFHIDKLKVLFHVFCHKLLPFTLKLVIFRFLPTRTNRRMFNIYKQIRSLLRSMIEKREKVIAMVDDDSGKDNLLDLLLKSSHAQVEASKNLKSGLTIEDVIDECKLFYFAGQETTENLLTWTLVVLSMHKNWQDRAREEVLQAIGSNTPSFDDLSSLKIVSFRIPFLCVSFLLLGLCSDEGLWLQPSPFKLVSSFSLGSTCKVLRLYPPVPSILRCTKMKAELGDLVIPAGVHISLPFYLIHHDPKLWGEDALEFNPERFSEGIPKASKDQTSYFPFGWGPRTCIGQNFALLEAKYAIVAIPQKFWFELSPLYVHAPWKSPTLRPKFGAQIILNKF
ncbi:Cytochrome P450 [Dillenia turbinata]|uniref:Cytochrome P450 n=1 Tax=Dillenia turbinata TaxID=194707 RepID=A0AAN8UP75_9MAGN